MTEIADVVVLAESSVLGLRRRVRALAADLAFDPVSSTRLAIATSEIGRELLQQSAEPVVSIALTSGRNGISVSFVGRVGDHVGRWRPFFDSVDTRSAGEGLVRVTGRRVNGRATAVSDAFVERQRERFKQRSRDELLLEIRAQNAALEEHQSQLEETIEVRTAEAQGAREAAENASRAKSQFLSNMSHELRTPLNGVLGYAQILRRDPTIVGEQRRSLDAIENCGQHLLTLINDVLDLSKIEAGRLELDLRPTKLKKLLESVRDIVLPRADRHGLSFEIEVDEALPRSIITDATKLKQVLVNLLGNAVKFTEEGGVRLEIVRSADDRVLFNVRDSGIGMTPEEQALVFQPFKQAEGGRRSGGTGLGLAISRKICEALDGTLRLESEWGAGSCFIADLPLLVADDVLSDSTMEVTQPGDDDLVLAPGQHASVLVADDVEVNRDVLVNVLSAAGITTYTAVDGQQTLDFLAGQMVDLVLMDIRMPVMDGMEATRRIRDTPALAGVKVVAVTADAFSDFRQKARDGGFDSFLAKPLQMSQLFRTIRKQLGVDLVSRARLERAAAATEVAVVVTGELDAEFVSGVRRQLSEAAEIGDIGLFETVARDLDENGARDLAERIRDAVHNFDFDAAAAVALDLVPENPS